MSSEAGCSSDCGCHHAVPRRDFLKTISLTATGALSGMLPAVAGPFDAAEFERLIPADKKLRPDWLRSLVERGEPTVYRGTDLQFIGMPIGGIGTGQLYLGGDGRLWHWDIFNLTPDAVGSDYRGGHYEKPAKPRSPIHQGFAVKLTRGDSEEIRPLTRRGFSDIAFRGQYPIGLVEYRDPATPLTVALEAFSPFIPLDSENSGLPATVMEFTIHNNGPEALDVELSGWLENATCLSSGVPGFGSRSNVVVREPGFTMVDAAASSDARTVERPEIVFEDFEKDTWEGWTVTGTAFGKGPVKAAAMPSYQGNIGAVGTRLANSHHTRGGEDVAAADAHVGTLTSRPFVVERDFINVLIGGGQHAGKTCFNLLLDGQVVASITGRNENRLAPYSLDVRSIAGRTAQLQIVDDERGAWGNVGVDQIVFSDRPATPLTAEEDYGSLALVLLDPTDGDYASASIRAADLPESAFLPRNSVVGMAARLPFGDRLVGLAGRRWKLAPGASAKATFVLAWHFAAVPRSRLAHVSDIGQLRRAYAKRYDSAAAVARHVAANFASLAARTRLWHDTWHDSTLPWWLLERTFLNNSIAATATCWLFDNGRFHGWEGTYCCPGTCQHVWHYAQGLARVFPQLERAARELTDYGIAFHENGALDYRAEADRRVAVDGQAGTILRAYREHQMSADASWLQRLWPRVKQSIEYLIQLDGNGDGLLEGEQYNTLDAAWYGQIAWLSSLYCAALRAGAEMARDMGDATFARRCEGIADLGKKVLTARLFNGEYFIHKPDPKHTEAINTNDGCHIDQVFGQSWAWQVGLPRVLPATETKSALEALWRYNFTPDVGPYRDGFKAVPGGRWYAMPGEGGLLMCTWPKGGAERASGKGDATFVGYFNECMTGFEYQVAAHLVWEGLVEKGLAVTRMIHDRYQASKRNPWNEIECGDHYARAMASHGVFLAVCGFEHHGPRGHLGFAPRLTPEDFRAPFITAEGWGTFSQKREGPQLHARVELQSGRLRLRTLALAGPAARVSAEVAGRKLPALVQPDSGRAVIRFREELILNAGEQLTVTLS